MQSACSSLTCVLVMWALIQQALPARHQPGVPRTPREVMRDLAAVTDGEWAAVERGEAIAKLLDSDNREVAVAGAVRIAAPREAIVARLRDVESLKRPGVVLDVGIFSTPPRPEDLDRVSLEDRGLDLRDCRPGDCPVRLSADDIARFHREVDWSATDWRARSASVWRSVLASHTAAYISDGRRSLPVYSNKEEPLSVASELALLVERFAPLSRIAPDFYRYLDDMRPSALKGAGHLVYWTKEDFGIRPVIRISHQVALNARDESLPILVATNQIYADHYLDAGLGVLLAIDVPEKPGDNEFYMISVNRVRTRSLSSWLRTPVRSTVRGRSRDAMRKILVVTKQGLEQDAKDGRRGTDYGEVVSPNFSIR
jgi:hypothetical protein